MTVDELRGAEVMMAVSGGLDSCTITHWLSQQGVQVLAYTADLGQPDEERMIDLYYWTTPNGHKITMFLEEAGIKYQIVPTENDSHFRNKLLQGEVHDENAYILGGVSGHAGLFSNASDIAKLSKLFLNEGTYLGRRYIKKNLVDIFTSKIKNPAKCNGALY